MDAASDDLMVIAELEKNGADLTQPRDLVHYLYVPSEGAAEKAAAELRTLGYTAEAKLAAGVKRGDPNPWLVLANMSRRSRPRSMGARAVRRASPEVPRGVRRLGGRGLDQLAFAGLGQCSGSPLSGS